ncbi:PAS-domain containing protein [Falsochrobactrum sp. TDYN1]|uniref:histidine kinase n=1 Tax=Falsochrobactrum tianjinense TaxID=2706015 RepID=A0A949UTF3_9HYPH|nr:PAS-domain containing protein [Falsochrobactrum sp. TDYN1]
MPEVGSLEHDPEKWEPVFGAKSCVLEKPQRKNSCVARSLLPNVLKTAVSLSALVAAAPAFAQTADDSARIALPFGGSVGAFEVIQFSIFVGALGAALLSAGWLIRDRSKISNENNKLHGKLLDLNLTAQRNEALLNLKDQRIVVWDAHGARADLVGQLPFDSGAPQDRSHFLAFGRWLRPQSVIELERAITALREQARAFDMTVETVNGALLDVHGRTSGSFAIARFLSLEGVRAERAALQAQNRELSEKLALLRHLLDRLDQPAWVRDGNGRIDWVNGAYARAVDAVDGTQAVAEGRELFGAQARQRLERNRFAEPDLHEQLPTVVRGDRRVFDVTDVSAEAGSAGLGFDLSEVEQMREELSRTLKSHAETLDQLSTAVAIFDPEMKLQFFNQAFVSLWSLDTAWLETQPSNTLFFDRLRSEGKLPEQPEWRKWKDSMLSAYRAVEPQEHMWHLPDTRIMRAVANPHPQGGVTWFFENMTEKFELEGRYNTLIKVQGETLDHLVEAVAVFGSDGRLRLSNPSFAALWSLPALVAVEGTHISIIAKLCRERGGDGLWDDFVSSVTGFLDERKGHMGQAELDDGIILSYAVVPLPKGQTMLTFIDVTDTVRVERALKEKNEALSLADQIKNDFVQHVSYELRSPLTNIIGFTELLQTPAFGSLNERQLEYLDHIGTSSSVLLAIVNDILDLATVDAGIMQLDIDEVSIADEVDAAAKRVSERFHEHDISLHIDIADDIEVFKADANRVRQVLFNLLSNAANYAPEGSTVALQVVRDGSDIVFAVRDEGPGMPTDVLDTVFKRFQAYPNGGRKRGVGLGLSIVKSFVELHGGKVVIETGPEAGLKTGTMVICRFPSEARSFRAAAE